MVSQDPASRVEKREYAASVQRSSIIRMPMVVVAAMAAFAITLSPAARAPRGAHLLLQTRTRALDGTLRPLFERWHPGLATNHTNVELERTAA